jgi:hypothetical protein
MPSHAGPNTLGESNLVFAYDTGDVSNSYRGEPTTNLALFNVTVANLSNDYGTNLVSQTADYTVTYKGRPSLRVITVGQWNLYRPGRPGNFTATNSTVFTFSWKMKWSDGKVPSFVVGYIYTDAANFFPGVTVTPLEDGWYLCQATAGGTSSPIWLAGFNSSQTGTCFVTDWQVETKSYATQFTPAGTTRSVTQGLLPLIGNSTIDLTNVSFTSNAQMVFDGTNDYIAAGNPTAYRMGTSDFTLECVMKQSKTSGHCLLESRGDSLAGYLWVNNYGTPGRGSLFLNYGGNQYVYLQDGGYVATTTTQYYYMVVIANRSAGTLSFFVNGNKTGNDVSIHNNSITPTGGDRYWVGADLGGSPWQGEIPVFKHYNRALTAQEVQQNYQQYKTRFNLS